MANTPTTPREKQAWDLAKDLHKNQIRKFVGAPYFDAHVQKVNGIVKQYTTDEDLLVASLLHDTLEDCFDDPDVGYIQLEEQFGKKVADIVKELTSSKEEIEWEYGGSKTDYLIDKMVGMSDGALIVKLADRLQNIADAFTASEKFRNSYFIETKKIVEQLESLRKLNRVQLQILSEIKAKLDNIQSIFKIKKYGEF
jgi:(p)ppGpp synthase/HD superfamily hydrolase